MEQNKKVEYLSPVLYSRSFHNAASIIPLCLRYSDDNQMCLINSASIHILELCPSVDDATTSQLLYHISLVPNPKDETLLDVGINPDLFCQQQVKFKESYAFGLDLSLNPNRCNAISSGFSSAHWSPSNCTPDGRALLGTVSVYGSAYIHGPGKYTGKWKTFVDITDYLHKDLVASDYKKSDPSNAGNLMQKSGECEELLKMFDTYRRRQYYLAITDIHWCPVETGCSDAEPIKKKSMMSEEESDCIKNLLVAVCNKLGWILILRIKVNLMTQNIEPSLELTIKPGFELAGTISWYQEATSSIGYIAVAYSNGCIKICTVEAKLDGGSFLCNELQIYNVWNTKDLMTAKSMQWTQVNGQLTLVVAKMADILILTMKRDEAGLITEHSYKLGPSSHDLPIITLSCNNDFIVSAGLDGITQRFKIGDETSHPCRNVCKQGYSCMGMQISTNGLMIVHVISPSAIIYMQGRFSQAMETIIYPFLSMEEAAKKFVEPQQALCLEFCEFFRLTASQQPMPDVLKKICATRVTDDVPLIMLQKIEFIKELMDNHATATEDKENHRPAKYKRFQFSSVRERLCRDCLKSALQSLNDDRQLSLSEKTHVLLNADWLVLNSSNESSLELAKLIYVKLNEKCSVEQVSLTLANPMTSREPQPQNDSDKSKVERGHFEAKAEERGSMPARETCKICNESIALENEYFAECSRKHHWLRCHMTLTAIFSMQYRTCNCCHRSAQNKVFDRDSKLHWLKTIVNKDTCLACNGKLVIVH